MSYLVDGPDIAGLAYGDWKRTQPPQLAADLTGLIGNGVEVCYVTEDLADRGIERRELAAGAQAIAREEVAELVGRYGRVRYW